jgi:hypothetical protein
MALTQNPRISRKSPSIKFSDRPCGLLEIPDQRPSITLFIHANTICLVETEIILLTIMKAFLLSVFAFVGLFVSVLASPIGEDVAINRRQTVDNAAARVDQLMAQVQSLTASISRSS